MEQQGTQAGTSTTTVYVGNSEQLATSGSTTTTTTYYYANGQRIALAVNGVSPIWRAMGWAAPSWR